MLDRIHNVVVELCEKMAFSPFIRPLGIAAAIIGIIQGLVWSILSLIAILIHTTAWSPKPNISTYGGLLSHTIVRGYLNGVALEKLYIVPSLFFMWNILYFIASLFWMGLSCYQLGVAVALVCGELEICLPFNLITPSVSTIWKYVQKCERCAHISVESEARGILLQDKQNLVKKAFLGWANWTLIICICDLILTSLLASDYNTLVQAINLKPNETKEDYIKILACGIVMTLTARGFILWIVNLTFAITIMKLSIDLPKKIAENESNFIDAFGNPTKSRNWAPDKPIFSRKNSDVSSKSFGTFHGLPRLPPVQSTNQPLARLIRANSTRSLNNIARPVSNNSYLYSSSPSPSSPNNYSTPGTSFQPPLKSALKNQPTLFVDN